jgi:hypothetical protein
VSAQPDSPPDLGERLTLPSASARGFAEAEEELRRVRERFGRQLEGVELSLWSRRNRLERFLIQTRGAAWWHARRGRDGAQADASEHEPDAGALP